MSNLRAYSIRDLLALPAPPWLVEGIIPESGLAILYGPPGSFKTFVALDLAMAVAAGIPWHGRATRRALVVYVSAEGGAGLGKRVHAWLRGQAIDPADYDRIFARFIVSAIRVHPEAGDLDDVLRATHLDAEWQGLLAALDSDEEHPSLFIVVDTLARCFEGDENQQEDMGAFVRALDYLRESHGATVLVLHHMNAGGERERGNTSLRGAADTMMKVSHAANEVTLSCDKQKDWEAFDSIDFTICPVEDIESLYLQEVSARAGSESFNTVRAYISEHPHQTVRQVAEALGLPRPLVARVTGSLKTPEQG